MSWKLTKTVHLKIHRDGASMVLITEAGILERLPEIDPDARIGKIELGPCAIKRLFGHRVASHEERELLMPLAGPGDLLLGNVLNFGCYSFHAILPPSGSRRTENRSRKKFLTWFEMTGIVFRADARNLLPQAFSLPVGECKLINHFVG